MCSAHVWPPPCSYPVGMATAALWSDLMPGDTARTHPSTEAEQTPHPGMPWGYGTDLGWRFFRLRR